MTKTATAETIATATAAELEAHTVAELKQMASEAGLSGYSRLRKAGLVAALLAEGERLQQLAQALNADKAAAEVKAVSEDLGEFTVGFIRRFKSAVERNLDLATGETKQAIYPEISGLATNLVSYLDSMPGYQAHGGLADTTKLRYRSEVTESLKNAIEAEQGSFLKPALESAVAILDAALGQALADKYQAKKTGYRQSIAERKEEKTEIDPAPLLTLAENILVNLETLKKSQWRLVSIALALVTGRRMAEIHNEATRFEVASTNPDALNFTGQLKAKGAAADYYEENPSYEIPCLVYPALAVAGHDWLKEHGKLCADAKKAHNRFSRYLSEAMAILQDELGIEGEKFNYKALRAIYGQVAFMRSGASDEAAYLAKILGHGRGDLAMGGKRITDFLTPQSYNSDWKIKI